MSNPTIFDGIECYGDAYPVQNYYVKFDDLDLDYIDATVVAGDWPGVIKALQARHPGEEILEVEAV